MENLVAHLLSPLVEFEYSTVKVCSLLCVPPLVFTESTKLVVKFLLASCEIVSDIMYKASYSTLAGYFYSQQNRIDFLFLIIPILPTNPSFKLVCAVIGHVDINISIQNMYVNTWNFVLLVMLVEKRISPAWWEGPTFHTKNFENTVIWNLLHTTLQCRNSTNLLENNNPQLILLYCHLAIFLRV